MTYEAIAEAAKVNDLLILGGVARGAGVDLPENCETLLLLGPTGGFWDRFTTSSEWRDGAPDPVDRWSKRVVTAVAEQFEAAPIFPFGGPPFQPFFSWALKSGQAWQSPVNLLVHSKAGLMVSYRGALALQERIDLPPPASKPCDSCHQPCLTACIPRALTTEGYDVPACHAHLDTEKGRDNMTLGCSVRRACPVSQSYGRVEEQSAYHMRIFHGESR